MQYIPQEARALQLPTKPVVHPEQLIKMDLGHSFTSTCTRENSTFKIVPPSNSLRLGRPQKQSQILDTKFKLAAGTYENAAHPAAVEALPGACRRRY